MSPTAALNPDPRPRRAPDEHIPLTGTHRTLPTWSPSALLVGSAAVVAALLLTVTGWSTAGFVVLTAVVWILVSFLVSRAVEGPRKAVDRVMTMLVATAFVIAVLPLVSLAWTVVSNGIARFDVEFFTFSMRGVVGVGGGAYHAMMGTLIMTALAAVMAVPVGLLAAIYLVEYGTGRLARAVTFLVDVMTGIPSIVAGLFAYALFVLVFGEGVRMGVMGSVALAVLMIPLVVRSTEEMLRLVPNELREAAYALGVPKWLTITKVVLRTSVGGIATGVTLAIARVIGETAPLLVTAGATTDLNLNPFDERMASLPVFAFYSYTQPGVPPEASIDRAWTAALLLIILVMLFNLLARLISTVLAPRGER